MTDTTINYEKRYGRLGEVLNDLESISDVSIQDVNIESDEHKWTTASVEFAVIDQKENDD